MSLREKDGLPRVPVQHPMFGEFDAVTVTRYHEAREALADTQLRTGIGFDLSAPRTLFNQPGFLLSYNGPEHTRLRRMLTGAFTVRRLQALSEEIERVVDHHLDELEKAEPGVDLVEAYALPIPSLIICELLGVPYADREQFQERSTTLIDLSTSREQLAATFVELNAYMSRLVADNRAEPGDGLLGALVRDHGDDLTEEELIGISLALLMAGHETVSTMAALSVLALLLNPEQLALLRDEEDVVNGAIEELLRYVSMATPVTREAADDLTIGDQPVRKGERVLVSLLTANHDPSLTPDRPGELLLDRTPVPHVAFGHGIHQCLGHQMARMELRIMIPRLVRRFPGLRLAVPPEELEYRLDGLVYGVKALPVTW